MPLSPGNSRSVISQNIREMVQSGYPQKQAVAASLSNARRHPKESGGLAADDDAPVYVVGKPDGMTAPGNMDVTRTPGLRGAPSIRVDPEITDPRDPSGYPSSVLSNTITSDGRHVLVPGVKHKGYIEDPEGEYRKTGENLGSFDTAKHADAYAEALHQQQMHAFDRAPPLHKAMGGPSDSFFQHGVYKQSGYELNHPGGLIHSNVAGRTDRLPMSVAADSYVMPADVVSGLGEGNTLAGAKVLNKTFGMGPWGTALHPTRGAHGHFPAPPHAPHFATGGNTKINGREPVKIIAAGGEFIIPPHIVQHHPLAGGGDMEHGHKVLDKLVKKVREKTRKTLGTLPGPKKD